MCGIFGFTEYNKQAEIMAPFLAAAMEARGTDSHGIAFLDNNYNIDIKKDVGPISRAFYTTSLFEGPAQTHKAVVAHTRAASKGKVTKQNAHPFLFTYKNLQLAGTHNGVITNYDLLTNISNNPKFPVDSQFIWYYLLLRKDLKELHGWGSCAALITTPRPYMLFFRFNHEALNFVDLPEGGIAYASTEQALSTAYSFATGDKASVYTIDPKVLYAVDLTEDTQTLVPIADLEFGERHFFNQTQTYFSPNPNLNPNLPLYQPPTYYEPPARQCIRCNNPTQRSNDVLCQNCITALNNALIEVLTEPEEEVNVRRAGN